MHLPRTSQGIEFIPRLGSEDTRAVSGEGWEFASDWAIGLVDGLGLCKNLKHFFF